MNEHDTVVLDQDYKGRKKGEIGTIVHVHNMNVFEIEFNSPLEVLEINKYYLKPKENDTNTPSS